jgi:hypothetical protein
MIGRVKLLLSAAGLWVGGAIVWAAFQAATPPPLSRWTPQGSVLTIEAKDFSSLLTDWSTSEQHRAWLASDNYAAFSRSRLFSRLGEAQQQFAASAGLPADTNFLNQVAGKESLFAWYDIGNLEFLYITHLPSSLAEQTPLLQGRSKFEVRKAGAETFYVRSQGEPKRTVAFATHGDYLLLATREDLLANALLLMQGQANLELRDEHWYAAATAAAMGPPGDLRMTLNLTAIVPSPYFRSYWVQRNISEMKQYSASVSDLYRTPDSFREERVLLPRSADSVATAADVAPVMQYLPKAAGVYRATSQPSTDQVVSELGEKLLFRDIAAYRDARLAPVADLSQQRVGSTTDLETRIDTPPLPAQPVATALAPLRAVVDTARVRSMLVTSSTGEGADHVFLPIHSTIVLAAGGSWNVETLQSALAGALRARLTAGDAGLQWQSRTQGTLNWYEFEGLQPLSFAVAGNVCVLASDSATLLRTLNLPHEGASQPQVVTVEAGFSHTAERAHFARIASLLDPQSTQPRVPAVSGQPLASMQDSDDEPPVDDAPADGEMPAFFAKNIRSLSDTFTVLDSETFTETPDPAGHVVRQTVVYRWKH